MSNHSNPYSVQFNSDPRSRHGNYTPFRFISNNNINNRSHPYIVAQRNKKISINNTTIHNGGRYQAIPIKSNSNSISPLNNKLNNKFNNKLNNKFNNKLNNNNFNRSNRKRKYIDTFEDDSQGQYEYNQSLIITPSKKQHITEQTVMKSISMIQKIKLNKNNKSDIQFEKPSNKSWQDLIQRYYKNNKHCNVLNFTKMEQNNNNINNKEDFEMGENKNGNGNDNRIKKKRPIRLHHSYTGFTKDGFLNSDELKKIANKCYVSSVKNNKNCMENKCNNNNNNNDIMDCD